MKPFVSSFLLGVISAFCVAQLSVYYHHGFSFTVAFNLDPFFVALGFTWLALVFLGYLVWRILRGHRVTLNFGRLELGAFVLGLVVILVLAVWLHSLETPDYKVFPYVVIPKLFIVALASFWALVIINFRPNNRLVRTPETTRHVS